MAAAPAGVEAAGEVCELPEAVARLGRLAGDEPWRGLPRSADGAERLLRVGIVAGRVPLIGIGDGAPVALRRCNASGRLLDRVAVACSSIARPVRGRPWASPPADRRGRRWWRRLHVPAGSAEGVKVGVAWPTVLAWLDARQASAWRWSPAAIVYDFDEIFVVLPDDGPGPAPLPPDPAPPRIGRPSFDDAALLARLDAMLAARPDLTLHAAASALADLAPAGSRAATVKRLVRKYRRRDKSPDKTKTFVRT